jgi:hypothetical protein
MQADDTVLTWRKSSASPSGGNCVEVAATGDGVVVRNSKRPYGSTVHYTDGEWRAFLAGVKAGEFDDLRP